MIAMSRTLSRTLRGIAMPTLLCAAVLQGAAPAAATRLSPDELAIAMGAYVDGIVEFRQFLIACDSGEPDGWDEAASTLVASLRGAGLSGEQADRLEARLAAGQADAASYDCTGDVARARLAVPRMRSWMVIHQRVLENLEIAVVAPSPVDDQRLAAVRVVVAADIRAQARMLGCMALLEPQWFPGAYADWYEVLARTLTHILDAGYDTAVGRAITDPARPGNLLVPVTDRQAAIKDCLDEPDWMRRMAQLEWYRLAETVREELAKPR